MTPIEIEVCVETDRPTIMERSVHNTYLGGADRIELCENLASGGTTPDEYAMAVARSAFGDRRGMLVMIRPRAGDFQYAESEIRTMCGQIEQAADAGANGVVFGTLDGQGIDGHALDLLVSAARSRNLRTTFHRAFDAVFDRFSALEDLISRSIDRVLTSGAQWSSEVAAVDALPMLRELALAADGRIELVIGGGIRPEHVKSIVDALPRSYRRISFHAYSSLVERGVTSRERVAGFKAAAKQARAADSTV